MAGNWPCRRSPSLRRGALSWKVSHTEQCSFFCYFPCPLLGCWGEVTTKLRDICNKLRQNNDLLSEISNALKKTYSLCITSKRCCIAAVLWSTGARPGSGSSVWWKSGTGKPWRFATLCSTLHASTMQQAFCDLYSRRQLVLSRQRQCPLSCPMVCSITDRAPACRSLKRSSCAVWGLVSSVKNQVVSGYPQSPEVKQGTNTIFIVINFVNIPQ